MVSKSGKQSEFLIDSKAKASPEVLSIVANLINSGREDLSHMLLKIDYLLQYADACVKQQDIEAAKEALKKAKARMDMIAKSGIDMEYLDNIFESIQRNI